MFDDAHSRSETFRRDMDETSRTHRNIYVGSALSDIENQPGFGDAGINPEAREVKESPAFGKAAGAETHFIVVKPGAHSLEHDERRFAGSTQLALVHELLHPSQMIRELADQGRLGENTEFQTQMREQGIASELGMEAGKDFPDVISSGKSYAPFLHDPAPRPNSVPAIDALPTAPIGYFGPTPVQPLRPSWQEWGGALEFPRYAAASPFGNAASQASGRGCAGDPNTPDSKPVRYQSSRLAGRSEAPASDAGVWAAPLAPPQQDFGHHQAFPGDRTTSATGAVPLDTFQPGRSQQRAPLVGLVSGEPMPSYPVRPPIFGFPQAPAAFDEDWLMQLLAPRGRR